MSICEDAPASAAGRGNFLPKFGMATIANRMAAWLSGRRNRRLVASMRDFDDAQLSDIGLDRRDVETALRAPGLDPMLLLIRARQNPLRGVRRP